MAKGKWLEGSIESIMAENPEYAEALLASMKGKAAGEFYGPMGKTPMAKGQEVGPYNHYVAANPLEHLSAGISRGMGLKKGKESMEAQGSYMDSLIDQLRGGEGGAGRRMDAIEDSFAGQAGQEGQVGLDAFGGAGEPMGGKLTTPPPPANMGGGGGADMGMAGGGQMPPAAPPMAPPTPPRPPQAAAPPPQAPAAAPPPMMSPRAAGAEGPPTPAPSAAPPNTVPSQASIPPAGGQPYSTTYGPKAKGVGPPESPMRPLSRGVGGPAPTGQQIYGVGERETPKQRQERIRRILEMQMNVAP